MKLMCKICSLYGDRNLSPSSDNIIAEIDEERLKLPLNGTMFTGLQKDRGIPDPWQNGLTWDHMYCPNGNHKPWAISIDKTLDAITNGGPSEILTDQGIVKIDENGIVKEGAFVCSECRKIYRTERNYLKHMEDKHNG